LTAGLLAQVMIVKFTGHMPLCHQERSSTASVRRQEMQQVAHSDATRMASPTSGRGVPQLDMRNSGDWPRRIGVRVVNVIDAGVNFSLL